MRAEIVANALELKFDAVGFADAAAAWEAGERLADFLKQGLHGDMGWLDNERRSHPRAMWDEARSAIVLGVNYGPEQDPLDALNDKSSGAVSVYAQGADYHDLIKKRLKALARWLAVFAQAEVKVFVDTAPLMEKPLAARTALGWQGKHTNLVSRDFGSWLFLGVVLTNLPIPPDAPETDHCGSCQACLDICPTRAFIGPYRMDARRCISYLTIEHKGDIPDEFLDAMGNRIYGCDDCLAVCPWNKFARTSREEAFAPRGANGLAELLPLDDAAFRLRFAKSPIKWIGRDRFLRNVLIAAGNSGRGELAPLVRPHLDDQNEIVARMARRALERLAP